MDRSAVIHVGIGAGRRPSNRELEEWSRVDYCASRSERWRLGCTAILAAGGIA